MPMYNKIESRRVIMGKLAHKGDLLEELTEVCENEDITLGKVEAIGAVQKGRIGYYDQEAREYRFTEIDKSCEIASLVGNVSVKDGKPMVHAHIVLADEKGGCYAGHLAPGNEIFACEFVITVYQGLAYVRDHDEQTGLPLWNL